jgi:hypothetical protein
VQQVQKGVEVWKVEIGDQGTISGGKVCHIIVKGKDYWWRWSDYQLAKTACEKILGLVDNVHWGAILWELGAV